MRKFTPWTLLYRRLKPLASELHRATPWRIAPPQTVDQWLQNLRWIDLLVVDLACSTLCEEPPALPSFPLPLTEAVEGSALDEKWQAETAQQVMHRLLFAMDLCRRLPPAYRQSQKVTGYYPHDAELILIDAWRTGAALYWAKHFGPLYY